MKLTGSLRIIVVAVASMAAWMVSLCCFFPVFMAGVAAYQTKAVLDYESTPGYFDAGPYRRQHVDETFREWKESLLLPVDVDMASGVRSAKDDLILRYKKMAVELSRCFQCESSYEDNLARSNEKIAEIQGLYASWRAGLVSKFGEDRVGDSERRYGSTIYFLDKFDQATTSRLLLLLVLCALASCVPQYLNFLFKAWLAGYHVIYEAVTPDRAPLAALLYPGMSNVYPFGAPIDTVKRVLNYVTGCLIGCFSWGVGIVYAQSPQTSGLIRRNGQQSLVVNYNEPRVWQPPQNDGWKELVEVRESSDEAIEGSGQVAPHGRWHFRLTRLQGMFNVGAGAKVFTPEAAIAADLGGKVSASSLWFCDFRPGLQPPQQYICAGNVAVSETKRPWLSAFGEPGFTKKGASFALGGRLTLTSLPGLKGFFVDKLKHLSVSPMLRVAGPVTSRQILFAARTVDFPLGKHLKAYAEGIYRWRQGADYSWVDFRVSMRKCPWLALGGHWEPLVNRWMLGPRFVFR